MLETFPRKNNCFYDFAFRADTQSNPAQLMILWLSMQTACAFSLYTCASINNLIWMEPLTQQKSPKTHEATRCLILRAFWVQDILASLSNVRNYATETCIITPYDVFGSIVFGNITSCMTFVTCHSFLDLCKSFSQHYEIEKWWICPLFGC